MFISFQFPKPVRIVIKPLNAGGSSGAASNTCYAG